MAQKDSTVIQGGTAAKPFVPARLINFTQVDIQCNPRYELKTVQRYYRA
jgi:hypothetical protein